METYAIWTFISVFGIHILLLNLFIILVKNKLLTRYVSKIITAIYVKRRLPFFKFIFRWLWNDIMAPVGWFYFLSRYFARHMHLEISSYQVPREGVIMGIVAAQIITMIIDRVWPRFEPRDDEKNYQDNSTYPVVQ